MVSDCFLIDYRASVEGFTPHFQGHLALCS